MGLPFFSSGGRGRGSDRPAPRDLARYEVAGFNGATGHTVRCTVVADAVPDALAKGVRILERASADVFRLGPDHGEWSYRAKRLDR